MRKVIFNVLAGVLVVAVAMSCSQASAEKTIGSSDDQDVRNLIFNFIVTVCPKEHKHETFQEALDCISKYIDETARKNKKEITVSGIMIKNANGGSGVNGMGLNGRSVETARCAKPTTMSNLTEKGPYTAYFNIATKCAE